MEKRRIDLSRCLVRDGKADCHCCEEICPQKAIKDHVVDTAACDGCGLCSAVCPVAAIVAPEDYEGALTKAQELAPQVLMCEKASEGGVHCLGFLTRRLLWALAAKRPLALDISHCEACRPAVFAHLEREVAACNDALAEAGKKEIALVHVKPAPPKPKKTKRSSGAASSRRCSTRRQRACRRSPRRRSSTATASTRRPSSRRSRQSPVRYSTGLRCSRAARPAASAPSSARRGRLQWSAANRQPCTSTRRPARAVISARCTARRACWSSCHSLRDSAISRWISDDSIGD